MKTNFLLKLIVLLTVCVSLNSCTIEELINGNKPHTATPSASKDGEPALPNPR